MIVAAVAGGAIGSLPTADWIARLVDHDLRTEGTGNPGTRNALAIGGPWLGAVVLVVELGKGALAVAAGRALADDAGGALAAIGAVAGNVYNPWFRFRGGKGLAIAGGTLMVGWPPLLLVLGPLLAAATAVFRKSGPAALIAFVVWAGAALLATVVALPTWWGLDEAEWLVVGALGSVAAMAPKHTADTLRPAGRPASPG